MEWPEIPELVFRLCLAAALGLPIAWDRERRTRSAGLRTYPLVSMGACAYVLVGEVFIANPAENPGATARILQGLLSGIGFIGGGAILKNDDKVAGTASAASIWITGAVGVAVGLGSWSIAITLSVLNLIVVVVLSEIKSRVPTEPEEF
ncbi:MAG: MgtC/SapB family protein [Acidobacteria bacterium]|nr:MAG: MgtC/SapB family protein [Acidobacteriota bacterium]REK09802.1 MAG: MgtC/SapB family protein [Acidobacteriota bacterium]